MLRRLGSVSFVVARQRGGAALVCQPLMSRRASYAPLCTGVVSSKKSAGKKKPRKDAVYHISVEMQVIVGADSATRTEVVQAIWKHIRAHGLQNPNQKKEVICDETLQKVMGNKSSIQITEIFKHMQPHFKGKKE